ncbi:MAG: RNA methyltransferase [Bacteroidetes bacterium]|nr:RNA methyltransferase [Bacteroidota bacterium]
MSRQNILEAKKLLQKKYREQLRKFIIEGRKMIEEAVAAGVPIESIFYDEAKITDLAVLEKLSRSAERMIPVKEKDIQQISDTVTSQGIAAVLPFLQNESDIDKIFLKKNFVFVALEEINDPGNLGTIIRTCDWFGVDGLVIGTNSVDLYNPKVIRGTMGSLFHLPILTDIDLKIFLKACRSEGLTIYSSELSKSEDVQKISFAGKSLLLIGNESHGISSELSRQADKKIMIPRFGKAESLNAAMACGILLSQMKLKK